MPDRFLCSQRGGHYRWFSDHSKCDLVKIKKSITMLVDGPVVWISNQIIMVPSITLLTMNGPVPEGCQP